MKIVFLDVATLGPDADLSCLKKFGELVLYPQSLPHDTAIERAKEADIILTNKVNINATFMECCPQLKLICVTATGTNNIDHAHAAKKNIAVRNVSNYSTQSVTQHTFSSLLSFISKPFYYDNFVKSQGYSRSQSFVHYGPLFGEIYGKTFGIIGMGNIGRSVAQVAKSFGANVIYFSTSGQDRTQEFTRVEFDILLKQSDFISIHSPLNNVTKNLIGANELKRMKSNSILINMGRGGIVDEEALCDAIDKNEIGGAILDVFSQEPLPIGSPLLRIKNKEKVLFTPHIAWASIESRKALVRKVCENIDEFLKTLN